MTAGKQEHRKQEKNSLQRKHITKGLFLEWQAGNMEQAKEESFLEHIGACTFCAEQFGNWMEEGYPEITEAAQLEEFVVSVPSEKRYLENTDGTEPEKSLASVPFKENPQHLKYSLLSEPPSYLKEEILKRTRQMDVQAAMRLKETSKQMQLFMYSLKVGLAVVASIFLLIVTANVQNTDFETVHTQQTQEQRRETSEMKISIANTLKQKSGEISSILNDLSNGLFRIETQEAEQERN